MYIVAAYNSELVWANKLPKTKKEPWWKRWLEIQNSVATQKFFRGIWSESKEHHKDTEWLKDVKKELEQDEG